MELALFDSPQRFYTRIKSFLFENEDENNLIIGIASRLAESDALQVNSFLAAVTINSQIVAAAIHHTPTRNLIVTRARTGALALFADHLKTFKIAIPGVLGPAKEAKTFAEIWKETTGKHIAIKRRLRIYRLDRVIPPEKTSGCMRQAQLRDLKFLRNWIEALFSEIEHAEAPDLTHVLLSHTIENGNLYLWHDGKMVSMAGIARSSPNGKSINLVYTPKEFRGRGYASNLVASLSEKIIQSGNKFCTLFTDLDNPTSNQIYINIGFRPICDFNEYIFTPQKAGSEQEPRSNKMKTQAHRGRSL